MKLFDLKEIANLSVKILTGWWLSLLLGGFILPFSPYIGAIFIAVIAPVLLFIGSLLLVAGIVELVEMIRLSYGFRLAA